MEESINDVKEVFEQPPSKFTELYKCSKPAIDQEERREKLLQEIKSRRNKAVDENRGISELFSDDEDGRSCTEEEMDYSTTGETFSRRGSRWFRNKLMLSEWFVNIPHDLEQNWLVKLCPVGSRSFVVAQKGITRCWTRTGILKATFVSLLPGGGQESLTSKTGYTVLDCIFDRKTKSYYILDVIAWNGVSYRYCDTEFRFFWLKTKLDELPELVTKSSLNQHCFHLIGHFDADLMTVQNRLAEPITADDGIQPVDGVLFYHRETIYRRGKTPLVGWLKPFMVPDMLNIPVHEYYMSQAPAGYVNMAKFLEEKRRGKVKKEEEMAIG